VVNLRGKNADHLPAIEHRVGDENGAFDVWIHVLSKDALPSIGAQCLLTCGTDAVRAVAQVIDRLHFDWVHWNVLDVVVQQEIARNREAAMRQIAAEREARARIERLTLEVENRSHQPQMQQQQQQQKIAKPITKKPEKRVNLSNSNDSTKSLQFQPRNFDETCIVEIYLSRQPPDSSLPVVPFTKKGDLLYLGLRKCEVIESDGDFYVKTGPSSQEPFCTWVERIERVEGLRSKAMNSHKIYATGMMAF